MSLDVWFSEDIKHILMATERAGSASLAQAAECSTDLQTLRAYQRGYRAALSAVALACGLEPVEEGESRGAAGRRRVESWT
jgi:hypothetical protein